MLQYAPSARSRVRYDSFAGNESAVPTVHVQPHAS